MTTDTYKVQKLQHPIRTRRLEVRRVVELGPSMRRITLGGDALAGFVSASFDDHVKLIVPEAAGGEPNVPTLGPDGLVFEEGTAKPAMRDYTPRRYDPDANELDIDFVLGHAGPATAWATDAAPGHPIGIAGPRGSSVVPTAFDWHVLIGDETAIPAIGRRLEELPASAQAIVIIRTLAGDGRIELHGECQSEVRWVVGGPGEVDTGEGVLLSAVRELALPDEGEGYVWAAGEYSEIRAVRRHLADVLGVDKSRIRAASYWRREAANAHERFD
ncbi:siderophore-interacting protein [Luteimonas arsenica]|uniref:siderophore-interacting protein n=1 Tax=Luteimonas arsenica TaxID=1586242 RepID=UPI00105622AC|nr:siderophore-interacting protein [Luteimonas arsenica]